MSAVSAEVTPAHTRLILIVEDHDDTRALYEEHFRTAGYFVIGARDGNEGIKLALARRPDVVVIDLAMPGLDGWETIRLLRAYDATRHLPILAVTAHDDPLSQVRAYDAGCDLFLAKPCTPENLDRAIRRCFLA
jgi:CheY-like chemotaxis protein